MRTAYLPTISCGIPCLGGGTPPDIPLHPGHTQPPQRDLAPETPTPRKGHGNGDTHTTTCEQTDTCENITFPQLRLRAV